MISREELITQLRATPSSLNDAMRTMEIAADFITRHAQGTPDAEIARLTPYVEAFRREEARADKLGQELDDLRAAQRAPDYSAWLIEMPEQFGPLYFQLEHDDDWTSDHNKACHFSRKEDAEKAIEYYGWTQMNAVEHMWPAVTSTQDQPIEKTEGGAS